MEEKIKIGCIIEQPSAGEEIGEWFNKIKKIGVRYFIFNKQVYCISEDNETFKLLKWE